MSDNIIPPIGKGPSRKEKTKLQEIRKKDDAEEENF